MSDKDNPFGPPPPDDPFGPPPTTDPFGRKAKPYGDPFGATAGTSDSMTPAPPYEARQVASAPGDSATAPHQRPRGNAEGAITALVLGIVGVVFCPLCAPFAWHFGRKAERLVDASGGALAGRGEATAGKILGMVACGLMVVGVVLLIALIAFGTSVDTSSSGGGSFQNF